MHSNKYYKLLFFCTALSAIFSRNFAFVKKICGQRFAESAVCFFIVYVSWKLFKVKKKKSPLARRGVKWNLGPGQRLATLRSTRRPDQPGGKSSRRVSPKGRETTRKTDVRLGPVPGPKNYVWTFYINPTGTTDF